MFVANDCAPSGVQQRRQIGGDEIGVFEDAEQQQVSGDGDGERQAPRRSLLRVDQQSPRRN